MSQQSRKSLREFAITTTIDGEKVVINYGYDLCMGSSTFYVEASFNGSPFSASKKTLARVQKMEIKPVSQLISLIGLDETGSVEHLHQHTTELVYALIAGDAFAGESLVNLFAVASDDDHARLDTMVSYVASIIKVSGKFDHVIARYIKTRRLVMLANVADVIRDLRVLSHEGISLDGKKIQSKKRGYLAHRAYPTYYKRDVDYIRKSRVRIYTNVLKREYKPA
jgi:hypothetical protein